MIFDKSRVFTALNADELKVGSKVLVADDLRSLKLFVEGYKEGNATSVLVGIHDDRHEFRFRVGEDTTDNFALAYLISEPEEKKLKWTDLKFGDVITDGRTSIEYLVTAIDKSESCSSHIFVQDYWIDDKELEDYWKKVE